MAHSVMISLRLRRTDRAKPSPILRVDLLRRSVEDGKIEVLSEHASLQKHGTVRGVRQVGCRCRRAEHASIGSRVQGVPES